MFRSRSRVFKCLGLRRGHQEHLWYMYSHNLLSFRIELVIGCDLTIRMSKNLLSPPSILKTRWGQGLMSSYVPAGLNAIHLFLLLFDYLIRADGSGWVGWAFAHSIFLEEKEKTILFWLPAQLLMNYLPTHTIGASIDPEPVNDVDKKVWIMILQYIIWCNIV